MVSDWELTGTAEIENNLAILTDKLRRSAVKKVMKRVITPIHTFARSRVSRDTGTLYSAIQMEIKTINGVDTYGIVGIRRGFKVPVRVVSRGKHKGKVLMAIPTRYANLVERGHRIVTHAIWERDPKSKHGRLREIKSGMGGTVVGFAKARPFMRPAWDALGKEHALKVFLVELDKELADEVSRLSTRRP